MPVPNLIDRERETYTDVWTALDHYGDLSPGAKYVPLFLDMARIDPAQTFKGTILDAGCGNGKGALALAEQGFTVTLVDVTDAGLLPQVRDSLTLRFRPSCLWEDLRPVGLADYVYCCDVLEHIPPTLTMLVVHRLLQVARKGVFLSVCLDPDVNGLWMGKALHLTVQSFIEWRDQLATIARLVESRDLLHTGLYYLEPR